MTPWYRQLWRFVWNRETGGTIIIAVFFALAAGVVPSILDQLKAPLWVFALVLVGSITAVIGGWALRRRYGVGVVVCLYPRSEENRVKPLVAASKAKHSSTFTLDRAILDPNGATLEPAARADLFGRLIGARIAEYQDSGVDGTVNLYPLAQMGEGYQLGRRLRDQRFNAPLQIMHVPRNTSEPAVPVIALRDSLAHPLSPGQQARVAPHIESFADGAPTVEPNPHCPPEHRHRLAFIVRLVRQDSMVDDAKRVATTGEVRRPTDGSHTGYLPPDGRPCGALAVLEATPGNITESAEVFEAVATHLYQSWRTVRARWAEQLGESAITTHLFVNAPLPIVIALGWITARDNITVVHHEMDLLNQLPQPRSAP